MTEQAAPNTLWKNRIVDFDPAADPEQLLANPANWRVHPKAQRAALEGVLETVGIVGAALVNVQTGHMLDGHMRTESAISAGQRIPVIYVDVTTEEEAVILASFDPIGDLAKQDDGKLRELLAGVQHSHGDLAKLLADHVDFGAAGGPATPGSDGSLLKLVNVTIGEPQHLVTPGDVWRVGRHTLVCAEVLTGWPLWKSYLEGEDAVFAPFPGPLVTLTRKAETVRLIMVQPDPYIAGHILDRAADVMGGDAITQKVKGHYEPTDDEIEPPVTPGIGRTNARPKRKKAA